MGDRMRPCPHKSLSQKEGDARNIGNLLRSKFDLFGRDSGRQENVIELKHLRLPLPVSKYNFLVYFVHTGVPHAVIFVPDIEKIEVTTLGRALRFHKAFGPAGANVDFVQLHDGMLHVRTYERGVENETLACGTGVVAAAAVARALGKAGDRVRVRVRGGDVLRVSFSPDGPRLEGPGEVVFQGEVRL